MYALIPVVSVSSASCSAQSRGAPSRNPLPLPNEPLTLNSLRTSDGRRSASSAARSMASFIAGRSARSA